MKAVLVIMSALLVAGLVAGIVVPHEQPAATALAVSAEQTSTEPAPNRIAYNRARGVTGPGASDSASSTTEPPPVLAPTARGASVPLADALGVAGLLGGAVVTVLLLQGDRPGASTARPEVPRQQS